MAKKSIINANLRYARALSRAALKLFARPYRLLILALCIPMLGAAQTASQTQPRLIGKIEPRHARDIPASRWSIGGETLDRDYADYHAYKGYLGPLGAKRIRLQGGWAKTEKVKGQYDWNWLDAIIDDAIQQGVRPWLQPSYGNPIYEGGGDAALAGGIPTSEEALQAWDHWVRAMTRRYADRVREWEIWNEPDLSRKITPENFAAFYHRTASIIREEQPNAFLIAFGLARIAQHEYIDALLSRLRDSGELNLVDAISYHGYSPRPENSYPLVRAMREKVDSYNPGIQLWQGENGCPSTPKGEAVGAMTNLDWSETTQAKWNLRRMLGDMGHGVDVTSVFQISDMYYAQGDHMAGLNSKGLLRANPDRSIAYAKPSYAAMQHVTAIFDHLAWAAPDIRFLAQTDSLLAFAYRHRSGGALLTLWLADGIPTDNYVNQPVTLTVYNATFKQPVFVDLRTGEVFDLPRHTWRKKGKVSVFQNLPLYDSPIVIMERKLALGK
jgi:hypothetical protein